MSFIKENMIFSMGLRTLSFSTMLYNNQKEQMKKEIIEEIQLQFRKDVEDEIEKRIQQIKKEIHDQYKELHEDSFIYISKN